MFVLFVMEVLLLLPGPGLAADYNLIQMCSKKFVKPGTSFDISCSSDRGSSTRFYSPSQQVPTDDEIEALVRARPAFESAEKVKTIKTYENATESMSGIYTCIVFHGSELEEQWSMASCQVQVEDLCANADCLDEETCVADYEAGTSTCSCVFDCPTVFDPLCSNTCELFFNPCNLKETVCKDKKQRWKMNAGFCPPFQEPTTRAMGTVQEVTAMPGERVLLSAGLVTDGTPMVNITWSFVPDGSEIALDLPNVREIYEFDADYSYEGLYIAEISWCSNAEKVVMNHYSVQVVDEVIEPTSEVTTQPPTVTSTAMEGPDNLVSGVYYTCSVFPGGAVETFYGSGSHYDLACSHVLVADVLTDGDYSNPWFIYGTFDVFEGKGALASMSFYLGRDIFEFQRGWLINLGGEKMILEEGKGQQVGNSPCFVLYENLHLNLDCPNFEAYYDGIMSGHIRMKGQKTTELITKGQGNFGLCFDNNSGWRKNWQVGITDGICKVDTDAEACAAVDDSCAGFIQESLLAVPGDWEWDRCGEGAAVSCGELKCGGNLPTEQQMCALERAARVSCALRLGEMLEGEDVSCPEDACVWQKDVVSRGCPQENPPFNCD